MNTHLSTDTIIKNKYFLFSETAQLEAQHHKAEQEASELKKEKLLLENQLEMEKMRVEAEKKKVMLAHEQLREKVQLSFFFVHFYFVRMLGSYI